MLEAQLLPWSNQFKVTVCLLLYFHHLPIFILHLDEEAKIVKRFLHGTGHYTPTFSSTNEKLEAAMRSVMLERNIQCAQLERTLHLAASLIEVRSIV
jgi:hypothetical protein